MKKQLTIIIGLLLSSSITVHAQVAQKLRELGMENIRTIETGGTTVAAFEDNVYRGTYRGVGKAIIAGMEGMGNGNLELVALDGNGIPQLSISLPDTLIAGYKSGEISLKEVYERMEMSYDTDRPMGLLKGSTGVINRSAWKADIVLYPEVSLENSTFDKLYSYRVNLSPAVEMDLWKGAKATAQVVFPIATNMKGEYKKIRPGVMTISQEIRFRNNFLARIVAGNFTDHRIGAQAEVKYRTGNGRVELGAQIGTTGYSAITDDGWYIGTRQRINAAVKGSLYVPQFNTQLDLQAGRYLYGDYGLVYGDFLDRDACHRKKRLEDDRKILPVDVSYLWYGSLYRTGFQKAWRGSCLCAWKHLYAGDFCGRIQQRNASEKVSSLSMGLQSGSL